MFIQGQNSELTKFSMLLSFPTCMKNNISENEYSLLEDLRARKLYKPAFSADVIHYALHLRYAIANM